MTGVVIDTQPGERPPRDYEREVLDAHAALTALGAPLDFRSALAVRIAALGRAIAVLTRAKAAP